MVDEQGIFANNELSLRYIDVFGFDYDYTLAPYNDALHDLIYDLAIDVLVNSYGVCNRYSFFPFLHAVYNHVLTWFFQELAEAVI